MTYMPYSHTQPFRSPEDGVLWNNDFIERTCEVISPVDSYYLDDLVNFESVLLSDTVNNNCNNNDRLLDANICDGLAWFEIEKNDSVSKCYKPPKLKPLESNHFRFAYAPPMTWTNDRHLYPLPAVMVDSAVTLSQQELKMTVLFNGSKIPVPTRHLEVKLPDKKQAYIITHSKVKLPKPQNTSTQIRGIYQVTIETPFQTCSFEIEFINHSKQKRARLTEQAGEIGEFLHVTPNRSLVREETPLELRNVASLEDNNKVHFISFPDFARKKFTHIGRTYCSPLAEPGAFLSITPWHLKSEQCWVAVVNAAGRVIGITSQFWFCENLSDKVTFMVRQAKQQEMKKALEAVTTKSQPSNVQNNTGNPFVFIAPQIAVDQQFCQAFHEYIHLNGATDARNLLSTSLQGSQEQHMTLFEASIDGVLWRVKECIEQDGMEINSKDEDGKTALIYAALYNQIDVVEYLLIKGADVNSLDEYDEETALHKAAALKYIDISHLLLIHGAKLSCQNAQEETPQQFALQSGFNLETLSQVPCLVSPSHIEPFGNTCVRLQSVLFRNFEEKPTVKFGNRPESLLLRHSSVTVQALCSMQECYEDTITVMVSAASNKFSFQMRVGSEDTNLSDTSHGFHTVAHEIQVSSFTNFLSSVPPDAREEQHVVSLDAVDLDNFHLDEEVLSILVTIPLESYDLDAPVYPRRLPSPVSLRDLHQQMRVFRTQSLPNAPSQFHYDGRFSRSLDDQDLKPLPLSGQCALEALQNSNIDTLQVSNIDTLQVKKPRLERGRSITIHSRKKAIGKGRPRPTFPQSSMKLSDGFPYQFFLFEQPSDTQRKSYPREPRYFSPNPVTIAARSPPTIQSGLVTVQVVHATELTKFWPNVLGEAEITQPLDEGKKAQFSLRCVETTNKQSVRLQFTVRFVTDEQQSEEIIYSDAFIISSHPPKKKNEQLPM